MHVLKHLDAVVERVEVGDVHMCAERNALCVLLLCRLRRVRAFLWRTSALFLLLLFLPFLCVSEPAAQAQSLASSSHNRGRPGRVCRPCFVTLKSIRCGQYPVLKCKISRKYGSNFDLVYKMECGAGPLCLV